MVCFLHIEYERVFLMAVKVTPVKCPECGADLPAEENSGMMSCSDCGTQSMKANENAPTPCPIQFPKINGEIKTREGKFVLPPNLSVDCGGFAPWCVEVFCQRMGLSRKTGMPWLVLRRDETLPQEGYRLNVTDQGIQIGASTEQGVIWALTTVYLRTEPDRTIACCSLRDAPCYPHRGQSLDCVRHFFPVEEVKRILEQLSLVKLNVLHFHLTDDQGWRIESLKYPQLHQVNAQYYTQDQLRELVEYARIRGMEIIPEIDLPGHTTAILHAFPDLGCNGEKPELATAGGIYTTILCAGKEAVYGFLEQLLEEICDIFPGKRIHIGGDEAPKRQWMDCPDCLAAMKEQGFTDFEQLQGYFTRRVVDILRKHRKIPVCWNETLKGDPEPEEMQIQYWTLAAPEKMDAYAKAGGNYIYSYMCELYLDYPYSMTGVRKLYNMRPHIWNRRCEKDPGLLGIEAAVWTEHIADPRDLEEHLFPRVYIVAEKAWSGEHLPYRAFLAMLRQLCRLAEREGICTMKEAWWNPEGRLRRREALDFFVKMNGGTLEAVPENQAPAETNLRLMYDYVRRFFRISDLPALAKRYFR